jgi:hypothetical protein
MSGGPRKTRDSTLKPICFEKGLFRPSFKWGSGLRLLKPTCLENQAYEHYNRTINM